MTCPQPDSPGLIIQNRYARQVVFAPIGVEGQRRLADSRVTLIGCGALGANLAQMMARAGVGFIRIVDRDLVELSNLQRQVLFDEQDIAQNLPKAEAAARHLRRINSSSEIEPVVADADHECIEQFVEGADLILDGTDNLQTRFLINDVAIKHRIPWIHGACLAAHGQVMVILPGGKPCLRCLLDRPPKPGQMPTCESAGILGPVVAAVAGVQACEALKILTGNLEAVNPHLVTFDLWENQWQQIALDNLRDGCPCCAGHEFEFLGGKGSLSTVSLCGRNTVQVRPRVRGQKIDLAELARRLGDVGTVVRNEFMLKLQCGTYEITVFPDGRAIVAGTNQPEEARSLYAKYIGH